MPCVNCGKAVSGIDAPLKPENDSVFQDGVICACYNLFNNMFKWLAQVIKENIANFTLTVSIARIDLERQHNASDLGIFWAVAKPVFYLFMFYFAITVGFRGTAKVEDLHCPYFIWLAAGIVQWQFISDLLVWGSGCFQRQANIVRYTGFPLTTVPLIAVMTRFYVYLAMIAALIITSVCAGVMPSIYWLQLPIYILLTVIFCYIWVMLTALINTISSDFIEFIRVIRTAFFWLSGIIYNVHNSNNLFFAFNPICYLAEGFRNCFAYHIWIWERGRLFIYFVIVMAVLTALCGLLWKRVGRRIPELV